MSLAPETIPTTGPGAPGFRIGPRDPRYLDLSRGCNQRYQSTPEYAYLIHSTAQAVQAVQEAVDGGLRIAIRSGGHCLEPLVDRPDTEAVLDMSELRSVTFDTARRAFAVEPGITIGDLQRVLYKNWGVTVPAGSCPSVGIGGHIAGGAYGPLSRRLGYLVDYLCGVEVVVVDADGRARAVVATDAEDDPNRELWWAHTGGGGGNFGVVTKYWLRTPGAEGDNPRDLLPNPPQGLLMGFVAWPWEKMTEDDFHLLVGNFMKWHEDNSDPDPASDLLGLYSSMILPHRNAGSLLMNAQMDATIPNSVEVFAQFGQELRKGLSVAPIVVQRHLFPWYRGLQWNGLYTSNGLETQRFKAKAADLKVAYSDEQISTIHKHLTTPDYPFATGALTIVGLGGMINARGPAETAIPQRSSVMKLVYSATWTDPNEDDAHIAWLREWYRDVHRATGGVPIPDEITDGAYINNPDLDMKDPEWNTSGVPWHTFYYKDNYPRLQRVKAKWDPLDTFRHPLSIQLPE